MKCLSITHLQNSGTLDQFKSKISTRPPVGTPPALVAARAECPPSRLLGAPASPPALPPGDGFHRKVPEDLA